MFRHRPLLLPVCLLALAAAAPVPGTADSTSRGSFTAPPAPPVNSRGFRPTSPAQTPQQALVPPSGAAASGVIAPPATVDRGIARPTPPAAAFPTPVIKPPPR